MYHTPRFAARLLGTCLFLLLSMASKLQAQTRYQLSFPNLNGHLLEVEARFEGVPEQDAMVYMPVWTPGSYLIREYSKNVESLTATDDAGSPIPSEKAAKDAWRVSSGGKPFRVRYRVYCNELAVRNAHIDATHAFFTPAAVLVYVKGLADKPHAINLTLPTGWTTVSTPLVSTGKNAYQAANLDQLIDSPFEIGTHAEQGFEMEGVRYRLATYPATARFSDIQLRDIQDVVTQANRVYGAEPPPLKEYLFITHLAGGGGGLEHLFGSVLQGSIQTLTDAKTFEGFLSLVGHEYFHLWNVKRIRPRRLGPFDYQQENYTNTLWFAEGFTSYYDDLLVARAGKMSKDDYLAVLGGNVSNAGSIPGSHVHTLELSSLEAWIKYYRPNENSPNATVSYYNQGSVVGWATDMRIRALTKGAKSLDNLMQAMWQKAKADPAFYADRPAIAQALSEVCGSDQSAWLESLVAKPNYPDVERLALDAGLLPVDHRKDRFWPTLGISPQKAGADRIAAGVIFRDGLAEKAGIQYGDLIQSIGGKRITELYNENDFTYTDGQPVQVEVLRQGEPKTFTLNVQASPRLRWQLGMPGRTPKNLKGWLEKH